MTNVRNTLKSLGLGQKEIETLLSLYSLKKATVAALARHNGVPRTTIYTALASLLEKQMVLRAKVGKRELWEPVTPQRLLALKQEQVAELKEIVPALEQLTALPERMETSTVAQYKGLRGLQRVYDMVLELGRGERVLGFEGGRSSEKKMAVLPQGYSREWQDAARRKGIILEVVVSETLLDVVGKASTELLRAANGRASITYVLPDEAMDFHSDILVFGRRVAIITPSLLSAVVITDSLTSAAFRQLLNVVCMMGKKVDLNAFIAQTLKELENKSA